VCLADRAGKAVGRRRHQDQVHVVRHQAVAPARHGCLAAALCQEVAIQRIILLLEKHRRAAIAPLRDMMREAGDDQASKARYATENNFGGQCRQ